MPSRCCISLCRGNKKNGPKVSVFCFPKDEEIRAKWIQFVRKGKDYQPTKSARVCIQHFAKGDIEYESSAYDDKTGRLLTAPRSFPIVKRGAVPCFRPTESQSSSSSTARRRQSPNSKKKKKEYDTLAQALAQSEIEKELYDHERSFQTLVELKDKLKYIDIKGWTVVEQPNCILFVTLDILPVPRLKHYAMINDALELEIFAYRVCLKKLNKLSFPITVDNVNILEKILQELSCLGTSENSDSYITLLNSVLDFFPDSDEYAFIKEQIVLRANKGKGRSYVYSKETITFSTILHSLSPNAYRFLRESGTLMLPHVATLERLCNPRVQDTE